MSSQRILIIGGGFAGVKCARVLRRSLKPQEWEVVLFNRENHMVFSPLLADVAGASVSPDAVAAPLRKMLPGVRCRTEQVQKIDLALSEIEYESDDGRLKRMPYDYAVIACG
ncbi:MAG TPA: FAD-dependent oxidoreductase, partial [Terriglobales bacterium]|nr:FAD-dependent oxidoreductase [Terriglobales bacterium]